jgi:hypothetical protein
MARALGSLVLVLVAFASIPVSADAATYDVWACHLTSGSAVPAEGWVSSRSGTNTSTGNQCPLEVANSVGALSAGFFGDLTPGAFAGWTFTAPADTSVHDYTLWRTVHPRSSADAFQDYVLSHEVPRSLQLPYLVQYCSFYVSCYGIGDDRAPFSPANRFHASNLQVRQVHAFMACHPQNGKPSCNAGSDGTYGRFAIYSARVGLEDPYRPELERAPTGSLLTTDHPLQGDKSLSFSATDRGGGIENVGIVVDGQKRLNRSADPNAPRCQRPFTALRPCRAATDNTLAFDTAQLPNGPHTVQASVTDAAGNETRSDPVAVTTLNGSQPNGRGASRFVKLSAWLRSKRDKPRRSAVVRFGKTRFAEGRLTDAAGKPIAGAVLQVTSRVQRPGARGRAIGTVTTSEDGRFAYRIAKGPSRTVRFGYKAYSLDPAPVSTAAVSLGVRAGIRLGLKPRHVRNGQKIRFRGRLKAGPARKATRLTIDVLVPDARRRLPIGTVKADRNGRFRFTYRFRRTLVKARYRFQARLVPQPGYPYRGAVSRRVSAVVSP